MLHNPYPIYRRFLEQGPIRYVDYGSGMWAVFSHAVCSTSIREPLLSSKRTAALLRDLPAERKTEFAELVDRKSTRLNSSHSQISYAVFCLKKKKKQIKHTLL